MGMEVASRGSSPGLVLALTQTIDPRGKIGGSTTTVCPCWEEGLRCGCDAWAGWAFGANATKSSGTKQVQQKILTGKIKRNIYSPFLFDAFFSNGGLILNGSRNGLFKCSRTLQIHLL